MRLHTAKGFGLGILVCICLTSMILAFGCSGSNGSGSPKIKCGNTNDCPVGYVCTSDGCTNKPQVCVTHEDCTTCNICNTTIDPNVCTLDSNACVECAGEADCPAGYTCYLPTTGKGHCIPGEVQTDGDSAGCDPTSATACSGLNPACPNDMSQKCDAASKICVCKFKSCKANTDCAATEICDTTKGYCVDKPAVDGDLEPEPEPEPEPDTNTCAGGARSCQRTSDCSTGDVCIGGCCTAGCTASSCPTGTVCNTKNGYCEYCGQNGEEACAAGQCCNYAGFWYCGSCCVPACKADEACVSNACQKLTCPSDCGADRCCDAEHGYSCYDCPDGDVDVEYRSATCLGANASCKDGVDTCCSGTCLMGTCL